MSSAFIPLIRVAILVGFTMTLVVGGAAALDGTLAVGMYSVLVFMTQRLLWPLTQLGEILDLYQRAMASCRRIFGLLEVEPAILPGSADAARAGARRGPLRRRHLQLPPPTTRRRRHPDARDGRRDRAVLRGFSLHVPAGETHAIVGSTGSGKSTVLKLLLRLYEPDRGAITVDGVPIEQLTFSSLRGATGFVPQDVFLFHGTVRDNIAYGRPDATDEQIRRAAELAEADTFIRAMPHGYDEHGRRARPEALGRPASAHHDRPGAAARPGGAAARRGDLGDRQRDRGRDPGVAGPRLDRPHHDRDRAPPVHHPPRPPHPRDGGRAASSRPAPTTSWWTAAACTRRCGGSRPASSPSERQPGVRVSIDSSRATLWSVDADIVPGGW